MRVKTENALASAGGIHRHAQIGEPVPTMSGDVAHGKKLYANCASCHGAKGEGNQGLNAPALAARSDWYLAAQLVNYQKGLRARIRAMSLARRCARSFRRCRMRRPSPMWWRTSTR